MSNQSFLSVFTVLFLTIGLVIGAGVGYFISSNTLDTKINIYEVQINELNSEVSSLASTLSEVEVENSNLDSQITGFENQIEEFEKEVSSLETYINSLESQVSYLENEVYSLNVNLSDSQSIVYNYETKISDLESKIYLYQSVLQSYLPDPIQIGLTATSTESLTTVSAVAMIAEEEINNYCIEKDYPHRFQFIIKNNYGETAEAVENIIRFNNMGIRLVVGHGTSPQSLLSLNSVNTRNMMMMSPSATSYLLNIANDNFYRTCPSELSQSKIIAAALESWGIKAIVVIQRGDEWGNTIFDALKKDFESRGGIIYKRIRYESETPQFISYLNIAESAAQQAVNEYDEGQVAVTIISSDEAVKIIKLSINFPTISNLYWFGSESLSQSAELFSDAPNEADQLKLFSPKIAVVDSSKYWEFANKFYAFTGELPDFFTTAIYDACWLYSLSVIKTWTTEPLFIADTIPEIAENYNGSSGWCHLDENGDRDFVDYDVWGYSLENGQIIDVKYGYYEAIEGKVSWNTD